jgi:type I restriction enzyme S subunit
MRNITKKGLQNSATNIVPKGSLLISTRVGIGKVGIAGIDVAISQDLTGLVPDKNKVNVEYLYWAILNKSSHLSGLSQGSTVKGLTRDYVRTLRIPLPPLLEQQQIAKILSTLDQAIEKVGEAIEKTQRLKKGLLQQLLTKGIGHKEFKDTEIGRIPKEWKSVKLEEISISSPQNGLYKNKESYGNGFKMVRMTELFREDVLIINDMALVNVSKEELARFSLRPGDLLFARRSLKIEGSGKCVLVPKIDESILFESSIIRITLNKTLAYPLFFLYYLNSVGRKQILKMTRTVAVSGITGRDLQNIFIPLPSLYEQQRIAEILSGVDERLELLGKRKERLEIVKRGLMNDLLTGRKRVRIEA